MPIEQIAAWRTSDDQVHRTEAKAKAAQAKLDLAAFTERTLSCPYGECAQSTVDEWLVENAAALIPLLTAIVKP